MDRSLVMPWDEKLVSLMNTDEFRDIVDDVDYEQKRINKSPVYQGDETLITKELKNENCNES